MKKLPQFILKINQLVLTDTKQWCSLEYPRHPDGCPNVYGKCWGEDGKKPQEKITEFLDESKPYYIVYNEFNLYSHKREMKKKHPDWSEAQAGCVLYWQKKSQKSLKEKIKKAKSLISPRPNFICKSPEEFSVNLYATCLKAGLKLDPMRRIKTCRHMAIIGYCKPGVDETDLGFRGLHL